MAFLYSEKAEVTEAKKEETEVKEEAPIPPARTKKSESLTSTEPKVEVKQSSTTAVESENPADEVPKTPILHQPSVQPEPPSGIMGYIRSFFSCMASKK